MKFGKVDKSRIVKHYVDYRIGSLRNIFEEHIVSPFNSEIKRIKKGINSWDDEYSLSLGEDMAEVQGILTELCNLFCVGLYSRVESLLNMLGGHLKSPDKTWEATHRWKDIKKGYSENHVYLTEIPKYKEINIIREINNCVKHSDGIITQKLQSTSNNLFIKGKKLETEPDLVLSYFKDAEEFLYDLIDKLKSIGKYD